MTTDRIKPVRARKRRIVLRLPLILRDELDVWSRRRAVEIEVLVREACRYLLYLDRSFWKYGSIGGVVAREWPVTHLVIDPDISNELRERAAALGVKEQALILVACQRYLKRHVEQERRWEEWTSVADLRELARISREEVERTEDEQEEFLVWLDGRELRKRPWQE